MIWVAYLAFWGCPAASYPRPSPLSCYLFSGYHLSKTLFSCQKIPFVNLRLLCVIQYTGWCLFGVIVEQYFIMSSQDVAQKHKQQSPEALDPRRVWRCGHTLAPLRVILGWHPFSFCGTSGGTHQVLHCRFNLFRLWSWSQAQLNLFLLVFYLSFWVW